MAVTEHFSPLEDLGLPSLRDQLRPSSEPFIVEKYGEMPEGAAPSSQLVSRRETPVPFESGGPSVQPTSSFPLYNSGDDTRTSTPEPIKVMHAKKKQGTSGKKKRTLKEVGFVGFVANSI